MTDLLDLVKRKRRYKMEFEKIEKLFSVREYIVSYLSSSVKSNVKIVNYLNNCLSMIDKKIISYLSSDEFKEFINYEGYDNDNKFNLSKLNGVI